MKKLISVFLLLLLLCSCAAAEELPVISPTPTPAVAVPVELPPYAYTGDDPFVKVLTDLYADYPVADLFTTQEGFVTVPCPMILKREMKDDTHAKVYFAYWILNYTLDVNVLVRLSGGMIPGAVTMEKTGEGWTVTGGDTLDWVDHADACRWLSEGDRELEAKYAAAEDLLSEENTVLRKQYLLAYVRANNLPVIAYQDGELESPVRLK